MTTAVATRRVRITAKKWNRALETFPEAAAIPRTGTRLRHSRVARMAPMRREPFALAAPSASGAGALALGFSRDLEAISHGEPNLLPRNLPAAAERSSLEPGHASLPGLAGRQLAAGTGGQVPAHRITAFVRRVTMSSSPALPD